MCFQRLLSRYRAMTVCGLEKFGVAKKLARFRNGVLPDSTRSNHLLELYRLENFEIGSCVFLGWQDFKAQHFLRLIALLPNIQRLVATGKFGIRTILSRQSCAESRHFEGCFCAFVFRI